MAESILIVYVHGFKGTDVTFEDFPERLRHVVAESAGVFVQSKVFPVFETKGELQAATDRFVEWLTDETVALESGTGTRAMVVLCGHSMGGLLVADAAVGIKRSCDTGLGTPTTATMTEMTTRNASMWPRIVAVIAFDTPYLGLNPAVFKNGLTKYAGHVEMARNVAAGLGLSTASASAVWGMFGGATGEDSAKERTARKGKARGEEGKGAETKTEKETEKATTSRWGLPFPLKTFANAAVLGGGAAAAAAVAAYWRREDLVGGWTWVTDHAVWLKNLWDSSGMRKRIDGVGELRRGTHGVDRVVFRNFYTLIPPKPPQHPTARSFCLLPATTHPLFPDWRPTVSSFAEDEVQAHIGMFSPKTNEGFYALGLEVGGAVMEGVEFARGRDGLEA